MKTKKTLTIIVMVLVMMTFTGPLFSFGSDFLDHMDKLKLLRFFAEKDFIDGRIILRFSDKIQLSPKQLDQVESLLLKFEELSISKNAEIKIMELRLTSQLKAKKTDRQAVEKLLRDMGNHKTDLFIAYLNYLFDLREILTPDQIKTLREMKTKFRDHMRERRLPPEPFGDHPEPPDGRAEKLPKNV